MRLLLMLMAMLVVAGPVGAGFLGVAGEFADLDSRISARTAPVLVQRGVNAVLLNMRGTQQSPQNWVKVHETWAKSGAAVFWDAPATLAESDWIQGFGENVVPISESSAPRGGSLLSRRFVQELQSVATSMAMRLTNTAGYRILTPLDPSDLAYDRTAAASWYKFLEFFFGDKSPGQDTNGDTATFNSAHQTNYTLWQNVPLFNDSNDERKKRLSDLWLAKSQADYVGDLCGALGPLTRLRLSGPAVESVCKDICDASILASKDFVTRIYASNEQAVPALDCVAAAMGDRNRSLQPNSDRTEKRVAAAQVKLVTGDLGQSRAKLLRLLPYVDEIFLDFDSIARLDTCTGMLELDQAFDAVPELAPFVGKLRVERPKVLWIVPPETDTDHVFDTYCVTESALALDPNCVDLTQFTVVIYLNRDPCISTMILRKLFDYAIKGGIVLLDAYRIGLGNTLHGQKNSRYWWDGLRLQRTNFGDGKTQASLAGKTWDLDGTFPYLLADDSAVSGVGSVKDSGGAQYPLLLVRKMGTNGKWVYINLPDAVHRFDLVKAIVKEQSGIDLPDASRARVYAGEKCVLTIGGASAEEVTIPCAYQAAVAFDVGSKRAFIGKPVDGRLALPEKIPEGEAAIWTIKPYGRPIVLYTDGVSEWVGSTGDGSYEAGVLKFTFARRAFISSPERPKSLLVNGKDASFEYNEAEKLVRVNASGYSGLVQAELHY